MVYTIKSEDIKVSVDSVGIQLTSIVDNEGVEYVWQRNPDVWPKSAPVLFPVVGRSRNGVLEIEGKDYEMPIHGFIQGREIPVSCQKENEITFTLKDNGETKDVYPYSFEFSVTFKVEGKKLSVIYNVKNEDERIMYYGVGGHPGFSTKLGGNNDKYTDYYVEFEYDEELISNDTNMDITEICSDRKYEVQRDGNKIHLTHDLFKHDAMIFENLKSKVIYLKSEKHNKGLKFSFKDFPTIAIWSKGPEFENADYVCFEPWQSMGFRTKEGRKIEDKFQIASLKPSESKKYVFETEIF